ncbi:MAG: DUF4876 domain-containing protein [Ignavibacteria bacterium]|nr:DUF4876 domain-containing protein [Ignavibacteria bacterium]
MSFILVGSCENILNLENKPSNIERLTTFQIRLIDKSGYMKKLFGNNYVRDAEILLKSNTLATEYKIKSDTNGLATISGIISDTYILTSTRVITENEMEIITGVKTKNHKLVNTKISLIEMRADAKNEIELPMELVVSGSPLVISEIYACGPPGSGLYYHDKYVEVYNQTDSIIYLDGIIVAVVYSSNYLGLNYVDDPEFIHSKSVWIFPGTGKDYPLAPGEYAVCAEDAIDHRINAPNSVDLSQSKFEFYKDDAPDVDNPNIPNMIKIYQSSGNDWLIGGETGAIVIAKFDVDSIKWYDDQMLIPYRAVLDGVEYMKDPSKLDKKILNHSIDGGTTGGIQFYTGKSMERILIDNYGRKILKDDNNSSLDFKIIPKPTPQFHY